MLFYEYFKLHTGKQIKITFKNDLIVTGVLKSVDMFLNVVITDVHLLNNDIKYLNFSSCAKNMGDMYVRGSAIKCIDFEEIGVERNMTEASVIKSEVEN